MSLIGLLTDHWGGTLRRSRGNPEAASLQGLHSAWMRISCVLQSSLCSPYTPVYSNPSLRFPMELGQNRVQLVGCSGRCCIVADPQWVSHWCFSFSCALLFWEQSDHFSPSDPHQARPCLVSKLRQDQVLWGWYGCRLANLLCAAL